ncbi:MAG: UDP-4-amino-4,6-dideoxy-N-acetyl-beta-L-altrosamine transaminase [bacterium]
MDKIPYATQWIDDDDIEAVVAALKSANLTQGPLVNEFESKVAEYCGAKYGVAVNSGTSALHIACLAAGITAGDEVITSPITFVASANCVMYCGARPVFADVQGDAINIDPQEIQKKITARTKAIIPIHFAGNPCDLEEIWAIARANNLIVIEDAAHALGAEYKASKIGSCKYSDMTILSFHAVKHITTGEGGMVLTNNEELYEKLKLFRSHGITRDDKYLTKNDGVWYYEMNELGLNYRLSDLQCALGISQLAKLDEFVDRRREIALIYNEAFSHNAGITVINESAQARSAYHLYVLIVKDRQRIFNELRAADIIVNVHYIPVYLQPYYQKLGYTSGLCPRAEDFYGKALSIPMFPKMSDKDIARVIEVINKVVRCK